MLVNYSSHHKIFFSFRIIYELYMGSVQVRFLRKNIK